MNGVAGLDSDYSEFVEVDPTGRYGRYNEILGKGASKTVYRGFDEYEGIEVAWNQVKLYDFLASPEYLERLYCEIHLLKTLKHNSIMKFYTSWVDSSNRNINFVTEMFTSGTLRQYRLKHRRVNIRAVKHWCRQILKGLLYLHSLDPPVIHRDLKCDNIFVNGNQGEVKIGDLGLAAILRKSHAAHCVGTPEFMAPEVYEEEYNELVDIYSFGMCILEMVTFEYPYSECTHPAQIYKKVISGKKPEALYKVTDPEVRRFIEKCLATVSLRLSAKELLNDPFLQLDDYGFDFGQSIEYQRDFDEIGPFSRQPSYNNHYSDSSMINGYSDCFGYEPENGSYYEPLVFEKGEINFFACHEDEEHLENVDISIKGKRREDDGIFLRLRIADKEGRIRNIYFPFDIETDTALSVATEMVGELDMTDQDVTKIAEMIDGEISKLVPDWKKMELLEENPHHTSSNLLCQDCASNNLGCSKKNLQVLECSRTGCAAVHGRFEEITYQVDESDEQYVTDGAPHSTDCVQFADIWALHDAPELSSQGSSRGPDDQSLQSQHSAQDKQEPAAKATATAAAAASDDDKKNEERKQENSNASNNSYSVSLANYSTLSDDYENEIRKELRWLKAKYQMQLRGLQDQQLRGVVSKSSSSLSPKSDSVAAAAADDDEEASLSLREHKDGLSASYFPIEEIKKRWANQKVHDCTAAACTTCRPEVQQMVTAKSFYTGGLLLPQSLHRATSLPVDAVDY